jgi:hypothetical protein
MSGGSGQLCPKCQGHMDPGFVVDNTYGGRIVTHWAPGRPEKSFWTMTKRPRGEQIPIGTFRCQSCGYLESFARPEFGAE